VSSFSGLGRPLQASRDAGHDDDLEEAGQAEAQDYEIASASTNRSGWRQE